MHITECTVLLTGDITKQTIPLIPCMAVVLAQRPRCLWKWTWARKATLPIVTIMGCCKLFITHDELHKEGMLDISFLWVETTMLIRWYNLCYKLNNRCASSKRSGHLIYNTNYTADSLTWNTLSEGITSKDFFQECTKCGETLLNSVRRIWGRLLLGFVRTRVLMSRSRLNNRATMEADILSITGSLTPEAASVAPCFPFDITISLSWFPLLCLHYKPLYHRGRETSWPSF